MKRLILVAVAICLVGGLIYWLIASQQESGSSPFRTVEAKRGDIQSVVTATGELTAVTAVKVGAEVSGVIDTIFVEHNSKVSRGQLLAQINPETMQAQVDKAEAQLAKSKASYDSAVAQYKNSLASVKRYQASLISQQAAYKKAQAAVVSAQADVANSQARVINSQAEVKRSQAEFTNQDNNYQRWQKLFEEDLVSRSERDDAYTSMLTAKASLEAAQASLESAQATLRGSQASLESAQINLEGVEAEVEAARIQVEASQEQARASQASVAGAKADMSQAEATLTSAQVDLGKTSITSPIDGIVLSILVSEGQTVASQYQAPELFQLAQNLDEMQVEAIVDEADIGQIQPGNPANFTVDSWPEREFHGQVQEVRKAAETTNNVVTFPVIISTKNPDLCLIPGMTATVNIDTVRHSDVLLVPSMALRFRPSDLVEIVETTPQAEEKEEEEANETVAGNKLAQEMKAVRALYVVDPSAPRRLKRIEVQTGLTDGNRTEVSSPLLKAGDRVVVGSHDRSLVRSSSNNRRRGGRPF